MEEWGRWMEDNTVDMWLICGFSCVDFMTWSLMKSKRLKWFSDIRIPQGAQTDGHSGVKIFETSIHGQESPPVTEVALILWGMHALYVSVSLIYILTSFL